MHPSSAPILLVAALLQVTSAFRFTGPPTDEPLDLSRPITISWERGNRTADDEFALFFTGGNGTSYDDGEKLLFAIGAQNIDDGSLEWDPVPRVSKNQEDVPEPGDEPLHHFADGNLYYFSASFHSDELESSSIDSGNYSVINWDVSAAGRTTITPLLALVGMIPVVYHFL